MKRKIIITFTVFISIFFSSCGFGLAEDEGIVVKKNKKESTDKEIPENSFSERKWNILVYMSADNNLESAAIEDMYEMELSSLNTNEVSVFILLDRSSSYDTSENNWSGTRLYRLNTGRKNNEKFFISEELECPDLGLVVGSDVELDMSSNYVLSKALKFIREKFPATHSGFIMWGHGTGWRNEETQINKGFAYDDSSKTYMTLKQLGTGIKNGLGNEKLDLIGFDTCFGGELEVMYELRDCSKYFVGSEGLVMASGWDYTTLFNSFSRSEEKMPEDLCREIVSQFKKQYGNKTRASIIAVNLAQVKDYVQLFNEFCNSVAQNVNSREKRNELIGLIYSNTDCCVENYTYGTEKSDIYIDVNSLINEVSKKSNWVDAGKKQEIEAVESKLIIDSWASDRLCGGMGVYFATLSGAGILSTVYPASYIQGKTTNQIDFVEFCEGYVPTINKKGSLLDKLFYTNY